MNIVRRVSWAFLAIAVLVGCSDLVGEVPISTIVSGTLLDDAGEPLANAVVFVPSDGGGSSAALRVAQEDGGTCQDPSVAAAASTCTDGSGAFSLTFDAPLSGTVQLYAQQKHRRFVIDVQLPSRQPGSTVAVGRVDLPKIDPDAELIAAVKYALPSLSDFDLIDFDDAEYVAALRAHTSETSPLTLTGVPLRQPDGQPGVVDVIAYRFQPRANAVEECAFDPADPKQDACTPVTEPSQTFRGMPDVSYTDLLTIASNEKEYLGIVSDEATYQMSVVNLIGDELDLTYYGQALSGVATPSSLQGLRSVLDVVYSDAEVEKLLSLSDANYLLHNQIDLDVDYIVKNVLEDSVERDLANTGDLVTSSTSVTTSPQGAITPSNHFGDGSRRVIRAVMVADPTVYDPTTGTRLVSNYFARLDAMINRMDLFFRYVQVFPGDPAVSSLANWGNAVSLEAEIAGYRRLTTSGLANHSFPTNGCGPSNDYVTVLRDLSRDSTTVDNEFWMWWTNTSNYGGLWGCAFVNALTATPRDGAVGFTSFRNYTLETVGQTFMHETGHLMNGVHSGSATGTQCRLLGIFPFGVTGPSMLGSTSDRNLRANCFAPSALTAGATKRNVTRVAEYVHALP